MPTTNPQATRPENPVRAARARLGFSQFQLAVKAGVHPATVSSVERGALASAETAKKLAKVLGIGAEVIRP